MRTVSVTAGEQAGHDVPLFLQWLRAMLACLRSAALFGVEACPVHVEVDVSFGLPLVTMVGLPDASVRESRDRVRSAIRNSGFEFPPHRVTVNLAPADVRKAGSAFDLPIALGILAAQGVVERRDIQDVVVLGELSLDGAIQPARGVLPIAAAARRQGATALLLPRANAGEAGVVSGLGAPAGVVARRSRERAERSRSLPCPSRRSTARGATTSTRRTSLTSAGSSWPAGRSRSPARAVTTCCSSARPVRARP